MPELVDADIVAAAAGHRFPGGNYTVEHWENFLLTSCTGGELMANGVVHPIALFHVPILGSGTTIAEMFALGHAESDFSISIESYDWQLFEPLREDTPYQISGGITAAERQQYDTGQYYDRLVFEFHIDRSEDVRSASVTVIWHYRRTAT